MSAFEDYKNFIESGLMPQALKKLRGYYEDYCNGVDLDIQTKEDQSPASCADRETEQFLRTQIQDKFPDDGIWGEEFGADNIDRDYVWVLDPLDGTKEFLAKKNHYFGCLIGLCYQGKAILGAIGDPLNDQTWLSEQKREILHNDITLREAVLSCTNPQGMFKTESEQNFITAVMKQTHETTTGLNCIGFAKVIDGSVDIVIENDLKLHDIVPLIKPLNNAGLYVMDFSGNGYVDKVFNIANDSKKKFGIIVTPHQKLLDESLCLYQKRESA